MHEAETLSLERIQVFLQASAGIRFEAETRQQVYGWIERVLCQQQYQQQGRAARGLLRRYVEKMTGFSRAQVTRLISRYQARGTVQPAPSRRHRFPRRYTRADVELLAAVDEAHESLSGPAKRHQAGWCSKAGGDLKSELKIQSLPPLHFAASITNQLSQRPLTPFWISDAALKCPRCDF